MIKRSAGILAIGLLLASMTIAQSDKRVFNTDNVLPLPEWLQQAPQVKEVSGYRQWARVTPQPQPVISLNALD